MTHEEKLTTIAGNLKLEKSFIDEVEFIFDLIYVRPIKVFLTDKEKEQLLKLLNQFSDLAKEIHELIITQVNDMDHYYDANLILIKGNFAMTLATNILKDFTNRVEKENQEYLEDE